MFSIAFAILLLLLGCTAPHDNPLDPDSGRYVQPQPVGRCCYGGQQCLDTTESRCAELGGSWNETMSCADPCPAPYVPSFDARVWSEHKASGQFSEIWQVWYRVSCLDTLVTLDTAWVTYDGRTRIGLRTPRGADNQLQGWVRSGSSTSGYFGCGDLMECVIGVPFTFDFVDAQDSSYQFGPVYLFRVIASLPSTDEPDSGDAVPGPQVTLSWPRFSANYPYGNEAAVYSTGDSLIWQSPLLPKEQQFVTIDNMVAGDYYWTLTVIDSFGNIALSREASFTVTEGCPQ